MPDSLRGDRGSELEPLPVRNSELVTVRDAMRRLNQMVDALALGEAEKFVLMKGSRMVAVLASVEQAAGGEWQRCPICHGVGTVDPDFYSQLGQGTSLARDICRACAGRGMVIRAVLGLSVAS